MSDMVEKVARAIYVERATQMGIARVPDDFDKDTSPMPTASRALALAAIAAMREPTDEFVNTFVRPHRMTPEDYAEQKAAFSAGWRIQIDEALK